MRKLPTVSLATEDGASTCPLPGQCNASGASALRLAGRGARLWQVDSESRIILAPRPSWARVCFSLLLLAAAIAGPYRAGLVLAQTAGLTPLNDLGPGFYQGFPGGLYPQGKNAPPPVHEAAALAMAAQIVPRNAAGAPDPQGLIVMIAVGMSNTTHEFAVFERNQDANPRRNARVVLMDTALGGQTAAAIADPAAAYWTTMQQRLTAMGLSAAQVQVAWLKEADAVPANDFPVHAQTLRGELETVANNLHDKFPNLRICYLSSRIYGGYAAPGSLNPEPQAFESGFAVKWLIEDQISGKPTLNHGQLPGPVRAPLLLWGPYLWANGTAPRSDGLTWEITDLEADHTHPAPSGEEKVASLLAEFLARDATAVSWWPAQADAGLVAVAALKDAHVSAASAGTNFGSAALLLEQGGASPINAYLGFDVSAVPRPALLGKLSLRVSGQGGGRVSLVGSTAWSEGTITFGNAPSIGAALVQMPQSSRDGTIAASVTSAVNADTDGALSFALTSTATGQVNYHSKEDAQPPRLVLVVACAGAPDTDGDGRADLCDCAPADGSVYASPGEVDNLRWTSAGVLAWDSAAAGSGSGTRYSVMSGDLSEVSSLGTGAGDLCLASHHTSTQITDTSPTPLAGTGRYLLVRGVNACGSGRYETASDGRDRMTVVCP